MTATSGTIQLRIDQGRTGVDRGDVYVASGETWYLMIVNYELDHTRGGPTYLLPVQETCSVGANCSMRLTTF